MKFQELFDEQYGFISRHLPPPAGTAKRQMTAISSAASSMY
ncbi:MAG: hypothetical protein ACK4TO_00310 [Candidatus Nitrosotenuis sp.]